MMVSDRDSVKIAGGSVLSNEEIVNNLVLLDQLGMLDDSRRVRIFKEAIIQDYGSAVKLFLGRSDFDIVFDLVDNGYLNELIMFHRSVKCLNVLIEDPRFDASFNYNQMLVFAINNDERRMIRILVKDIRVLKYISLNMLRYQYFGNLMESVFNVDSVEDVIRCIELL